MNTIFGKLFEKLSRRKYYSQYGQDRWLNEKVFKNRKSGTFVEVGADDGVDKSNTYFFEKYLGWSGLCVEPSPERYQLLRANRSCACENFAASCREGVVGFLDIQGYGKGLSGITANYSAEHRERIEKEIENPDNRGSCVIEVQAVPLGALLAKHDIKHVDFCTIDTEGSEMDVLKSIDFSACKIDILCIENNYSDREVGEFLSHLGYSLDYKIEIDDVYFRSDFKTSLKQDVFLL